MTYDPARHHRRSIRLRGYDYTQAGAYFVTLCAQGRECLFGTITAGETILNELGQIVQEEWKRSSEIRREIELDEFVVMPNHMHGIIWILESDDVRADGRPPQPGSAPLVLMDGRVPQPGGAPIVRADGRPPQRAPKSLGSFVAGFKSAATKRINEQRGMPSVPVWQRNYYEHIIRNDADLQRIREYIFNNPLKWELDQLHPSNPSK
jgi:REP element-mobilizing transposase RayT